MTADHQRLLIGEYVRTIDDRHRLSLPSELWVMEEAGNRGAHAILVKERLGCLSIWEPERWQSRHDNAVELIAAKLRSGRLVERLADVQSWGRLLSTRHRAVAIAARGRLSIPEGFREFLGVEGGGEVILVGAAVCVEIWQRDAWQACLQVEIPQFGRLLDELSR